MRFNLIRVSCVLIALTPLSATGQQAQHRRLQDIRDALLACETSQVVWISVGDSRSAWRHWRGPGEVFRQFDVKHAALICPGVDSNNGGRDGLGQLLIGLEGISNNSAAPGGTLAGSGMVNQLPSRITEAWTTGVAVNPHFSRFAIVYSTSGGDMDQSGVDDAGGQFKRGDPSQGRNIESIQHFTVTDNRPAAAWLPSSMEFGFGGESGAAPPRLFLAPPSSSDSHLLITPLTLTHGTTTGQQIRVRHRHTSVAPPVNTGIVRVATRINFSGEQGIVFGVIAEGGWSTTDHLAPTVAGRPANTDAKYTDQGLREWLTKVMQVQGKRVVVEIDIGTNTSTLPGYLEWNGLNVGLYRQNIELLADRLRLATLDAGASMVHPLLVSSWQPPEGTDRYNAMRTSLMQLAENRGWPFYDQEGELRDRGLSDGGEFGLALQYREDIVHQNFAGMNLLGEAKWTTLMQSNCDTIDFNGDGLFPDDNDLVEFLGVLAGRQCDTAACNDIDFNNDGLFPDDADLIAFLTVLAGGDC